MRDNVFGWLFLFARYMCICIAYIPLGWLVFSVSALYMVHAQDLDCLSYMNAITLVLPSGFYFA